MEEMVTDPKIRTPKQVAERVLALIAVIDQVYRPGYLKPWIEANSISELFSPEESAFYFSDEPEQQQRVDASWRAEALTALLWSLKGLDELPPFDEPFDALNHPYVQQAVSDTESFVADACLRSDEELEAMEQFLYHQHWRVRNRDLGFLAPDHKDGSDPQLDDLHPGIVYERRYAMTWLVGWGDGASWDEVPTDT